MRTIKLGLISGRHELPVDAYILQEVTDPTDLPGIHISVYQSLDTLLKNVDSDDFVELYVTGLTSVTIEAIQYLIEHKIVYKSMHFDRDTGGYIEQPGLTRI